MTDENTSATAPTQTEQTDKLASASDAPKKETSEVAKDVIQHKQVHSVLTAASALARLGESSSTPNAPVSVSPGVNPDGGSPVSDDDDMSANGDNQTNVNKQSRPDDDVPLTFPQRLMEILSNEELSDIVTWLPHGRAFIIYQKKKFASEILLRYFKQSKYTSFTRKLNRWGFTRVTRGPETGAYYHDLFQRGNLRLCMQMSCQTVKAQRAEKSAFGAMPWSSNYHAAMAQNMPFSPATTGVAQTLEIQNMLKLQQLEAANNLQRSMMFLSQQNPQQQPQMPNGNFNSGVTASSDTYTSAVVTAAIEALQRSNANAYMNMLQTKASTPQANLLQNNMNVLKQQQMLATSDNQQSSMQQPDQPRAQDLRTPVCRRASAA